MWKIMNNSLTNWKEWKLKSFNFIQNKIIMFGINKTIISFFNGFYNSFMAWKYYFSAKGKGQGIKNDNGRMKNLKDFFFFSLWINSLDNYLQHKVE